MAEPCPKCGGELQPAGPTPYSDSNFYCQPCNAYFTDDPIQPPFFPDLI